MHKEITGGCKCGAVRYRGQLSDLPPFRCHCRDCQQLTGTGHSDMLPLERATFEISDTCRVFEMAGGSGKSTFSGFCPRCGSQLTRRSQRSIARIYVHAGSLDQPEIYAPARSIYADAAQPWDTVIANGTDCAAPDMTRN